MVTRLSCIIPAYNEGETLAFVVRALHSLSLPGIQLELIVVDDGSTDTTPQVIQSLQKSVPALQTYRHSMNRGKGASLRTGIAHATGEVLLFHDADLEYAPQDIVRLVTYLMQTGADAVYGSRFISRNLFNSALQRWGNCFLTFVTNQLYRAHLTDMETGYKLIRRSALRTITLKEERFGIEPELTAQLLLQRKHIVEIPISYRARRAGKKVRYLTDGLHALYVLLSYRLRVRHF